MEGKIKSERNFNPKEWEEKGKFKTIRARQNEL